MTKYILHGGIKYPQPQLLAEMSFFKEFILNLPKPAHILCVYAAETPDRWENLFAAEQENMARKTISGTIELELGSNNMAQLLEQIARAHAIYLRGGLSSELVKSTLMKVTKFRDLFNGKTVAGTSAGAYALARYYISLKGVIGRGLDVVPCKVIAHYTDERKADLETLSHYGEDLPVYALPETEFVIIEQ